MDNDATRIVSNNNTIIEEGNETIIDIRPMDQDSKLENEIDKMLNELEPPTLSERCIYWVPREIRKLKEEAYTPRTVSIGPFHHDNKNFEPMEQVKNRYMKKFFGRSSNSSLKSCIDFVKKMEEKIRHCYSTDIEKDSDKLVKMILVDSCFIIQYLISFNKGWADDDDHSLCLELMTKNNIFFDLILLENQVPYFVLDGLYKLATCQAHSILDVALPFFQSFIKHNYKHNFQSIKHFTHLVLILYRPPPKELSQTREGKFQRLCSSTNLREAGVRFRKKRTDIGLFDITFIDGVLEIPQFTLDDGTEIQIRNLMALELCQFPEKGFVTDYCVFMDWLINTTMDVDLLVDKKIIINWLGDNKAAAKFFNNLCSHVLHDPNHSYFSQVCKELDDYYEAPRNKLKAMLKRDYFHTPWQTASTIAAITLLVFTLIQAVCSIISTVNGK